MGLMDFTTDLELKGEKWEVVLDKLVGIPNSNESYKIFSTYYDVFILCASLGIMYDKTKIIESTDKKFTIGRNVFTASTRRVEVEFLLTTAIITSKNIDYTIDERLMIAFGEKETSFKGLKFLEEFANYGVDLISNIITNHDLETMENLKDMLKDLAQKDLIGDLEIDLDLLNNN